jgi:hypothetical protein
MAKTRKFWAGMACAHALLLPFSPSYAADQEQYIADDISVTIREKPSNDAESLGVIHSGARVSVLESLGAGRSSPVLAWSAPAC